MSIIHENGRMVDDHFETMLPNGAFKYVRFTFPVMADDQTVVNHYLVSDDRGKFWAGFGSCPDLGSFRPVIRWEIADVPANRISRHV